MLLLQEVNGVNGFITYYLLITVLVTGDAKINKKELVHEEFVLKARHHLDSTESYSTV